jgi:hypothetical protein
MQTAAGITLANNSCEQHLQTTLVTTVVKTQEVLIVVKAKEVLMEEKP